MLIKNLKVGLCFFILVFNTEISIKAQSFGNITYNDTFTSGVTYCPGDKQYDDWVNFRKSLDTNVYKFLKITMKGTFAKSGKECNDSFIVRRIANALKNPGTMFSDSCNGNKWVVSTPGSCMATGCTKVADNVGIAADGAINACTCIKPSWQIRPAVGNTNWGGVNTQSCSPIPSQRMVLEFSYPLYQNDASALNSNKIDICKKTNIISVIVKNAGLKTIDSLQIFWSINDTIQNSLNFRCNLKSYRDTLFIINSSINFKERNDYKIKIWTSAPNGKKDENTNNDTVQFKFRFSGLPDVPQVKDTVFCGSNENYIIANSKNQFDNIIWYGSLASSKILGVGSVYKTPFHSPGIYKYYVSASGLLINRDLATTFIGGNQQAGFMMDIKAEKYITIDSIALNVGANAGTYSDIEVFITDSTFGKKETDPSKWSNIGRFKIKSKGIGYPTSIPLKFNLPANKRYGIYVQTTNVPSFYLQYTNGNISFGDDILKLNLQTFDSSGKLVYGKGTLLNWGGAFTSRIGNVKFYYKVPVCESLRDSMALKINQLPIGAKFDKGFPFNSPDLKTNGTLSNPDIASVGNEVNYSIYPPFGYSNSDYGKTWIIKNINILTSANYNIKAEDTVFYKPNSFTNARLKYTPSKTYEDSLIIISAIIADLTNTKCDSTINRFLYIAYTPNLKIYANDTCLGNFTKFNSIANIKKGKLNYRWNFGNGDTSILQSPTYFYPNSGKYKVNFKVTTNYGITKDTNFLVSVFEIPNVKFKVNNACKGDSLSFDNLTSVSDGKLNYIWDFGDGNFSTKSDPKHIYTSTGDYFVKLDAESNKCRAYIIKKAYYFEKPIADFNFKGNCCFDTVFTINSTSIGGSEGFGSYWDFGQNEETSNNKNPKYIFKSDGLKIIKYKAISQFGCIDTLSKSVYILPSTQASFTNNATCNIDSVSFHNTSLQNSINPNYLWEWGDGDKTEYIKHPKHLYKSLGKKTVKLTAKTNNGCSTSFEKEINIMQKPDADFNANDGCIGKIIQFNNTSIIDGQVVYKWRFGDGDSSYIKSPQKKYNPNVASSFNVQLVVFNNGGCFDTATKQISVEENPNCDFKISSAQTGGYEFVFTPEITTYNLYNWDFGDGNLSSDAIAKHKYIADGKYKVKIYMKNYAGCECFDTLTTLNVNHLKIEKKNETIFRIFPNPSIGKININIIENLKDNSFLLRIYDNSGRQVFCGNIENNNSLKLNMNPGLYYFHISNKNGVIAKEKIAIKNIDSL